LIIFYVSLVDIAISKYNLSFGHKDKIIQVNKSKFSHFASLLLNVLLRVQNGQFGYSGAFLFLSLSPFCLEFSHCFEVFTCSQMFFKNFSSLLVEILAFMGNQIIAGQFNRKLEQFLQKWLLPKSNLSAIDSIQTIAERNVIDESKDGY